MMPLFLLPPAAQQQDLSAFGSKAMSFGAAGTREVAQMLQEQLPLVDLINSLGGWEFPVPNQTGGCCFCHFWENSKQTHAILNISYTR